MPPRDLILDRGSEQTNTKPVPVRDKSAKATRDQRERSLRPAPHRGLTRTLETQGEMEGMRDYLWIAD